jgi:diguanylate cyclase (GGDEF)-like protein
MGGDEFIVLADADAVGDLSALISLGESFEDAIRQPMVADGKDAQLGASIGLSVQTSAALDTDQLITAADTAMYEAKRAGGGVRLATEAEMTKAA